MIGQLGFALEQAHACVGGQMRGGAEPRDTPANDYDISHGDTVPRRAGVEKPLRILWLEAIVT